MDGQRVVRERTVVAVVVAALIAGVALYNSFDWGSGSETVSPAVVATTTTTTAAPQPEGAATTVPARAPASGGLIGSGTGALDSGDTAQEIFEQPSPYPPDVPNPTCDAATVDRAVAAIGTIPSGATSSVRDLVAIAEGCSNLDATGPVLGLSAGIGTLTPLLAGDLTKQLEPVMDAIREGCADVGYGLTLARSLPGVSRSQIATFTNAEVFCATIIE